MTLCASALQVSDTYDECVFRDDTLVLLEMTTRDMMEVRTRQSCTIYSDGVAGRMVCAP